MVDVREQAPAARRAAVAFQSGGDATLLKIGARVAFDVDL